MPRHPLLSLLPLALACAIGLATGAAAQDEARFDVIYRGLRVAEITLVTRDDGVAYALAGRVRATGIAATFARLRFDLRAEGRWHGLTPRPLRYTEDADTGSRASTVELRYRGQVPDVIGQTPPPGPEAVPPGDAAGHVDPLSAVWRLVGGGARDTICGFSLPLYDGVRVSALTVGAGDGTDTVECSGRYTRVAGFSPDDMAERRDFPFTARFAEVSGAFMLTEVEATSLLGPIRIVRRD